MTKHTLEMVEFRLNSNVTREAFLAEIGKSETFVSSLDGFIERHTAQNEDGLWIDVVKWRNMQSAKAAASQFENAEEVKNLISMINLETTKMQHFEVESTM